MSDHEKYTQRNNAKTFYQITMVLQNSQTCFVKFKYLYRPTESCVKN